MSDLIERLRKLVVLDEVGSNNNLTNEAADEIEHLQAQITSMTKDMESIKPWRELQRENEELRTAAEAWKSEAHVMYTKNEELRKELQQARHDLMVRETAKDEELAALKAKQESAEPVAVIKVWKHPIDGNHIDVSTYKAILDLPEGEYDLYVEPQTTPTAAVENFKRRAIAVCDKISVEAWAAYKYAPTTSETRGNPHYEGVSDGAYACGNAITDLPLIG